MNVVDFVMAYESGELSSDEEVIEGFQLLLDSGVLFQLQGHYGRLGSQLLEAGLILPTRKSVVKDYYGNVVC